MGRVKFLFSFVLLTCFSVWKVEAQAQYEPLEVVFDKPFYLTGETVQFTVWFVGKEETSGSKVVRCEILNAGGEIIARKRIKRGRGSGTGSWYIPVEQGAGHYAFRFYTLNNLNYAGENYRDYFVPIYSSLTEPQVGLSVKDSEVTADIETSVFSAEQNRFQREEAVSMSLDFGTRDSTEYSVRVLDANWLPDMPMLSFGKSEAKVNLNRAEKYPVERDLTYELELINPEDGRPFNSGYILLSQPAKEEFSRVSAKEGKVFFTLPMFSDQEEIQVHNLNPYLPFLPKVKEQHPSLPAPAFTPLPPADSTVLTYYKLLEKKRKLQELYPQPVEVSLKQEKGEQQESKLISHRIYYASAYIDLRNLGEFIENIIFGARLKEVKGVQTVRLSNEDSFSSYVNAPVYFVNGYLAGNEAEILQIPLNQIKSIEVYNTKASISSGFPSFMLGMGVISITTKTSKVPKSIRTTFNNLSLQGIASPAKTNNLSASVSKLKPVFQPVVYQESGLLSSASGRAELRFFPLSSVGTYRVIVDYKDAEGNLQRAVKEIEIER